MFARVFRRKNNEIRERREKGHLKGAHAYPSWASSHTIRAGAAKGGDGRGVVNLMVKWLVEEVVIGFL